MSDKKKKGIFYSLFGFSEEDIDGESESEGESGDAQEGRHISVRDEDGEGSEEITNIHTEDEKPSAQHDDQKTIPVFHASEEGDVDINEEQKDPEEDRSHDEVFLHSEKETEKTDVDKGEERKTESEEVHDMPQEEEERAKDRVAPPDQCFALYNGHFLKGLRDLEYALTSMTEEQFRFHTSDGRNDFADWIEGVFEERELAERLRSVHEREDMASAIRNFLSTL